jgi:hypothetical protein
VDEAELVEVVAPPEPEACPTSTLLPQAGTRRSAQKPITVRMLMV